MQHALAFVCWRDSSFLISIYKLIYVIAFFNYGTRTFDFYLTTIMWPVHHIQTEAWHAVSSFGTQISSMQGVSEQRGERFFLFMYDGCTLSHLKKRRVWVCVVTSVYVKVFVACSSLEPRQSSINRTGRCSFRNESSFLFDARQSEGLVCSKKSS